MGAARTMLTMEYANGGTLEAYVRNAGTIGERLLTASFFHPPPLALAPLCLRSRPCLLACTVCKLARFARWRFCSLARLLACSLARLLVALDLATTRGAPSAWCARCCTQARARACVSSVD